jgi:malonyl-CoA/methylmalonyl-CoA synthetase
MNASLYRLIESKISDPDRVLIETPELRQITGRELVAASGRYANVLAEAGVTTGDRVAAQIEKSPESLFLYLACLRIGAIFLPLNTAYTPVELAYFIQDSEPRLVVCRPQSLGEVNALAQVGLVAPTKAIDVLSLGTRGDGSLPEAALTASPLCADVAREADDIAAILYTSGTTGRSKGAMITHRNLCANALALAECWRMSHDDRLVHALPIFHTHGLFVAVNVALLGQAKILLLPKFDVDAVMAALPNASVMMGVPTYYTRLLGSPKFGRDAVKSMRLFISGSAPLLPETHREFEARTGHAIVERYGLTETNINTSTPYDGPRTSGTVGLPLPGVSVRVADTDSGAALPQDHIGMIEIKGDNVFKGYWRMPEKTAAAFRDDGYFITGDLGKVDASGYLHIVGRGKDLIISGGLNVYPKEIELEIDAIPGVIESAVIGVPHPDFGEGVTAVVVTERFSALDEGKIVARLEARLAKYKVPKRVVFVADLPRNTMGKVQKNILREQHMGIYAH